MLTCPRCGKEFPENPLRPTKKYCSRRCTDARAKKSWRERNPAKVNVERCSRRQKALAGGALNKADIGGLGELAVALDLTHKGWDVYRPISPQACCDVIAVKGPETRKIEVRVAMKWPSGNLHFHCQAHSEITEFAIVDFDTKQVFYVPREECQVARRTIDISPVEVEAVVSERWVK